MASYLTLRLFRWISGLLLILFVAYAMMFYGAGDPIKRMFMDLREGSQTVDQKAMDAIRVRYGLDQPFPVQFASYLGRLLKGDLGQSIRRSAPSGKWCACGCRSRCRLGWWQPCWRR